MRNVLRLSGFATAALCALLFAAMPAVAQIGKYVPVPAGSDADHALSEINAATDPAQKLALIDKFASELGQGYGGRTLLLKPAVSLNRADYGLLQPGDFAVTSDGVHTLAYLGDKTWIEADRGEGGVVKVIVPTKNPWFNRPVRLMRWRILSQ